MPHAPLLGSSQKLGSDQEATWRDSPGPAAGSLLSAGNQGGSSWSGQVREKGREGVPLSEKGATAAPSYNLRWVVVGVVLTVLCFSQAMQWHFAGWGRMWGCPQHLQRDGGGTDSSHPLPNPAALRSSNQEEKSRILKSIRYEKLYSTQLKRPKRDVDPAPVYVPLKQYLDERDALEEDIARKTNHSVSRLVLSQKYMNVHEIYRPVPLHWVSEDGTLLGLTSHGRNIQVTTSGYYHLSLTAMFKGRTSVRSIPSCSLKVHVAPGTTTVTPTQSSRSSKTLLFISRTQDGRGLNMYATGYPIDTAHASGVFLLHHGDVIHVSPDNWSLHCRIFTDATKTHLDAFLVQELPRTG